MGYPQNYAKKVPVTSQVAGTCAYHLHLAHDQRQEDPVQQPPDLTAVGTIIGTNEEIVVKDGGSLISVIGESILV
jgi:hypothetical protein